jgi:hypothetical protein
VSTYFGNTLEGHEKELKATFVNKMETAEGQTMTLSVLKDEIISDVSARIRR